MHQTQDIVFKLDIPSPPGDTKELIILYQVPHVWTCDKLIEWDTDLGSRIFRTLFIEHKSRRSAIAYPLLTSLHPDNQESKYEFSRIFKKQGKENYASGGILRVPIANWYPEYRLSLIGKLPRPYSLLHPTSGEAVLACNMQNCRSVPFPDRERRNSDKCYQQLIISLRNLLIPDLINLCYLYGDVYLQDEHLLLQVLYEKEGRLYFLCDNRNF